ncbi:nuclease-related domain-containing protein [Demequina sp. SO4-13]|uniref:nuclease-related domain-containing protein n=1 Tax=Demequina sp. SO4-13 TaxID=3401027 RepID=UPI003AF42092
MDDFTITRWKRYGHDRAYVADASGTKFGYVDLATGESVFDPGAATEPARDAVNAWCTHEGIPLPAAVHTEESTDTEPEVAQEPETSSTEPPPPLAPSSTSVADPAPDTRAPEWTDLSAHRPGEGVRQMADAEWAASKDRSKVFAALNRYVFDNHTDERAWRKGAEGEEYVGAKLDKLRDRGCHVLHSVPVGKGESDIDHIVIGPGGVFTINSKMHSGKKIWVAKYQMRVNGQPVPYLRNSLHEAERAKKLLDAHLNFEVPVVGCVVVLTGSLVPEVTYKQMPDDVRVLDKWDVPKWFKKRPAVLSPEQVEAVFEVARRSTTWT